MEYNKGKITGSTFLVFLIVLAIIIVLGVVLYLTQEEAEITIEDHFGSKIVYTLETDQPTDPFKRHCQDLGGVFNECGTPCAPDVDICASVCAYTCEDIPFEEKKVMERFSNDKFDFSLRYPAEDWNMYQKETDMEPKFNFYLKPQDPPLTPLSNLSHVSVYPKGILTEGLFGETKDLDFDVGIEVSEESKVYILEDGTPFAALIKPEASPLSWNESGFIWMRLKIEDLEEKCFRDGEEITKEECGSLLEDDLIARTGTVDKELWETQKEVVESIEFEEGSTIKDLIQLESPEKKEAIESPLTVSGKARGQWYFEGEFLAVLTNWDGEIIAEASAQAQEEWMTEEFVPFEAVLEFEDPFKEGDADFMKKGALILQKANPSGLPENDQALEIPIGFK